MTDTVRIAKTIISQIKAADYWALAACGYRQPIALSADGSVLGGVQFRVSITSPRTHHKIVIKLMANDTYTVERIKIKRGTYEVISEATAENVYCDMLASVVYDFCHNTPAKLEKSYSLSA